TVGKLAYILVSDGNSIVSYRIAANLTLQKQWSHYVPLHAMTPLMSAGGLPYLLVDLVDESQPVIGDLFQPGSFKLQYYQLSTTGMMLAGSAMDLGGSYAPSAQMFSFATADSGFTVVRVLPSAAAEIYHGWVDSWGNCVLSLQSRESWVADSSYDNASAARPNVLIQPVT